MNRKFNLLLPPILGVTFLLSACTKEISSTQNNSNDLPTASNQSEKSNTFKGPEVYMGNGVARSMITISHTGVPQELAIEMTAEAFEGLTQEPTDFAHATFVLPLHQKAKEVTPFDHLVINWNPQGHAPEMFYGAPHFDFHFYKISLADQLAIPPYIPGQTSALFDNLPPAGYMPANYVPTEGGVPQMGKHWIDPSSAEFQPGGTFTKTFIYGSYNGNVIFDEPMITMAYLQSGDNSSTTFAQPIYFSPVNTYYPTRYNVYTDANTHKHYVSLSDFVWR